MAVYEEPNGDLKEHDRKLAEVVVKDLVEAYPNVLGGLHIDEQELSCLLQNR
jgi:hypothetical protein